MLWDLCVGRWDTEAFFQGSSFIWATTDLVNLYLRSKCRTWHACTLLYNFYVFISIIWLTLTFNSLAGCTLTLYSLVGWVWFMIQRYMRPTCAYTDVDISILYKVPAGCGGRGPATVTQAQASISMWKETVTLYCIACIKLVVWYKQQWNWADILQWTKLIRGSVRSEPPGPSQILQPQHLELTALGLRRELLSSGLDHSGVCAHRSPTNFRIEVQGCRQRRGLLSGNVILRRKLHVT